jgi:hypothetical protein
MVTCNSWRASGVHPSQSPRVPLGALTLYGGVVAVFIHHFVLAAHPPGQKQAAGIVYAGPARGVSLVLANNFSMCASMSSASSG